MSATPARVAALEVVRAVRRGDLADRALFVSLDRLDARDRPWTQELVYGTLRLRGRIDHLLSQLVRQRLDRLEPDVLDILRLGAYQLLEMGSVPAYAAVSQSVELAKSASGQGAGRLLNGVLQSLRRERDRLSFPDFENDPIAYLSAWGSHPRWLVERWVARFGAEQARALVDANNLRPELYLRPIGATAEDAVARLIDRGIGVEAVRSVPNSLRLLAGAPAAPGALAAVPAVVQDPAATLVTDYTAPPAAALIADVAAAPGGKALALARPSNDTSPRYVVAGDVSYERILRVRDNARRVGDLPLGIIVADARRSPLREAAYDVVMLDAPCTGTGTFRRHPDGRWRVTERDLAALVRLQRLLLRSAAALVKRGGLLVYATCSLEQEENELQVEDFLAAMPEFALERAARSVDERFLDEQGRLLVLPQRSGFDGAFAVRLRRS